MSKQASLEDIKNQLYFQFAMSNSNFLPPEYITPLVVNK